VAVAAIGQGGFGDRLVMIRCNGLDTDWGAADWSAAIEAAPDAILAPKISSAKDLVALDRLLARAPAHVGLWAMIETAAAIVNLREIAACAATTRLQAFVVGTNDLCQDLRCRRGGDRAPLLPALGMAVAAARANGLQVFDGVYNDFSDVAGFEAECRQGVDFGFDGKTLIHPSQIDACNRLFSPPAEQVAWAKSVVAAFAAPQAEGKGAISLDGKMVERLHLAQAQRVLKVAGA
jgi:citrate lyase subunit beta/citryl-CoA lyase